jgi:hypothetical protein
MKKLLLAAAFSMVFTAGALAEDNRDQAFGKHDMGPSNDSMNKPNSATGTQGMATSKFSTWGRKKPVADQTTGGSR